VVLGVVSLGAVVLGVVSLGVVSLGVVSTGVLPQAANRPIAITATSSRAISFFIDFSSSFFIYIGGFRRKYRIWFEVKAYHAFLWESMKRGPASAYVKYNFRPV
jgi:hypothetical protein